MKILSSLALASVVCLALTPAAADKTFKPPKPPGRGPAHGSGSHGGPGKPPKNGGHGSGSHGGPGEKVIRTAANFGKGGAKIDLCPSGDCVKGQLITLSAVSTGGDHRRRQARAEGGGLQVDQRRVVRV
ncbi:hypothetical protein PINS_up015289 [Pythium insidiosum]|nr:hypothetical protein PINS_up015289 [Pythium insidiosum]